METVWKYEFPIGDIFDIRMPKDSSILHIDTQNDVPCMWVLVDDSEECENRRFRLCGTGHSLADIANECYVHQGSFQMYNDSLVFHVFEIGL